MRTILAWMFALVVAFWGAPASATPNFPDELQSTWGLSALPDSPSPTCLLCHNNPAGGLGTATTAFGTYLRSRGAKAYDTSSLDNALAADRGEMHDSDGNGVTDYDDMVLGHDPNGSAEEDVEHPRYGCSAARGSGDVAAWFGVACVLVALRRARLR